MYTTSPGTSWLPGETRTYQVTMKNLGTDVWNSVGQNRVRLGVHFGTQDDGVGAGWMTDQRFDLPRAVNEDDEVTIGVTVTAPTVAGNYVLRHRMKMDNGPWFDQIHKTQTDMTTPLGVVDGFGQSGPAIRVAGWAVDPETTASINVYVRVDSGAPVQGVANRSHALPDRLYSYGPNHGFDIVVPAGAGVHYVCVWAVNVMIGAGADTQMGCGEVSLSSTPFGSVETADRVGAGIRVTGWAIDPETTAPINVQIRVDSNPPTEALADRHRPDIGASYSFGDYHGFDVVVSAAPGTHNVCVWAVNVMVGAGSNPQIGCKQVTVPSTTPFGRLDSATQGGGGFRVTGWAIDPDTVDPIYIQVTVDSNVISTALANRYRPDVGAAYPFGDYHGFDLDVLVPQGDHVLCVKAVNVVIGVGSNPTLGCKKVTVMGDGFLDPPPET